MVNKTNQEKGYIQSLDEALELHGQQFEKIRKREKLEMIITIANNLMQSRKDQTTRGFVILMTNQLTIKLTESEKENLLTALAQQVEDGVYEHL